MTRKNFSEIMNHLKTPEEDLLLQIEKEAEQYPYCQTFWILLAAGWAIYDPLKFQQNLPKIATIIPDRAQLKKVLNSSIEKQTLIQHAPSSFSTNPEIALQEESNSKKNYSSENHLQLLIHQLEKIDEEISGVIEKSLQQPKIQPPPLQPGNNYDISKIYEINADIISESNTKKHENERLIDLFLEKQPTIPRTTGDFFNPEEIIERSIDETKLPVSETLAIILKQQGQYKRAIEIYQKLILENPEKSSYFAAQIKKLSNI